MDKLIEESLMLDIASDVRKFRTEGRSAIVQYTSDVREISIEEEEEKEDPQGLFDRALKDWEDNKE